MQLKEEVMLLTVGLSYPRGFVCRALGREEPSRGRRGHGLAYALKALTCFLLQLDGQRAGGADAALGTPAAAAGEHGASEALRRQQLPDDSSLGAGGGWQPRRRRQKRIEQTGMSSGGGWKR